MTESPVKLKNRYLAAILAWMVPGLGHFYQGRTGKGILYATCILGLFVVGLVMGDGKVVYWRWTSPMGNSEQFCFSYLFQFWTGLAALPALLQATVRAYDPHRFPPLTPILWGYLAEPAPNVLSGLYPRLGKLVEIGTLYTMVAGLLNILAIYDAYEGPAHVDEADAVASAPEPDGKPVVIEVRPRP